MKMKVKNSVKKLATKASMKASDQRRDKRNPCSVPVVGRQGGIFDASRTIDISKGGIGFISARKVPLNKEIAIQLDLDEDEDFVLVVGQVKWVRPMDGSGRYRIGLYFKSIPKESKSRLTKYFRENP